MTAQLGLRVLPALLLFGCIPIQQPAEPTGPAAGAADPTLPPAAVSSPPRAAPGGSWAWFSSSRRAGSPAEYYYVSGDADAKLVLDRWVTWVKANSKLNKDGGYEIPATLKWSGQPAIDWNEKT